MKSVRFGGHVAEVIKEKEGGLNDNYSIVMQQLRDPDLQSALLFELLQQFIGVVSTLDKSKGELVEEILSVKWAHRERKVVALYLDFLVRLIAHNSVHQARILHCLLVHFVPASSPKKACAPVVICDDIFELVHGALQRIFTLIPMTTSLIEPMLSSRFPFIKKDKVVVESYVKNLLVMTRYQPCLRRKILSVVVSKVLALDLQCPKHVILKSEVEDGVFEMDTDRKPGKHQELYVEKLNALMDILLRYIRDNCFSDGELTGRSDAIFDELISIFEKIVLPAHECSHVQFVMFYVCSFTAGFREKFQERLWLKITNFGLPVLTRQTALCYLASFTSRAKYVDTKTAIAVLNSLTLWIHSYLKEKETIFYCSSVQDAYRHAVFYSACQALFYVLVFRADQILDLPDGFEIVRKMQLEHIVTSRLNPLKYCVRTVGDVFARIVRKNQIAYCDTIIEKNNRHALPISGVSTKSDLVNPLGSFFPFDPYCLKATAHFIEDIYREWEGDAPRVEDEVEEDEIDFMETAPINIPDILDEEKILSDSLPKKTFGISPGFSMIANSRY